jgi:hypothetical protein
MRAALDPFSFVVISIAGGLNYVLEAGLLDEMLDDMLLMPIGDRRIRFTDNQRRRLAAKAKKLGRKLLAQLETIVTPETLMAWH